MIQNNPVISLSLITWPDSGSLAIDNLEIMLRVTTLGRAHESIVPEANMIGQALTWYKGA